MNNSLTSRNPPASTAGKIAALLLLIVVAFPVALAVGARWGSAHSGRIESGVLPDMLRVGSVITLVICAALAVVAGTAHARATLRANHLGARDDCTGHRVVERRPPRVDRAAATPPARRRTMTAVALTRASGEGGIAGHPRVDVSNRLHGSFAIVGRGGLPRRDQAVGLAGCRPSQPSSPSRMRSRPSGNSSP